MEFNHKHKLDYYDKILAGIAGSLALGAFTGFLTNIPLSLSVGSGALVAIILMYHGMFRHGPSRNR